MTFLAVILALLALAAIVAAVHSLRTDGYRRVRTAPILRNGEARHWQ